MAKRPTLTTDSGMPVSDNQNSITAGQRGPVLMQDFVLFEKLAHQNRERIPERGQHAKGSGAYGTLTITHDITKYTKAKVLEKGKTTEAFLRFSTVAGERGAADAERDVRGFALRLYAPQRLSHDLAKMRQRGNRAVLAGLRPHKIQRKIATPFDRTERLMMRIVLILTCVLCLFNPKAASAWGYQGHEVVGSIADQLLHDDAKQHVRDILNFTTPELRIAAPWADCVRSVVADIDGFEYVVNPEHFEYEVPCRPFKSPQARARMEDFAKRNWFNCKPAACHTNYHFDNVAIERDRYDRKYRGTNDHDLVSATGAAIAVLMDKPAPAPFSIKDKKEALLLLAHFVGDLHQPLHVSVVYLDADGKLVDPDAAPENPAAETQGGNIIGDQNISLHHEWDDIPTDIGEAFTRELLAAARSVPPSQGSIENWPVIWASDTIVVARDAFAHLSFVPIRPVPPLYAKWSVVFDDHDAYLRSMDAIKRKQLAKGGARLAELLNAIWP